MKEYDERASNYDEEWGMQMLYAIISDPFLKLLELNDGLRILEVGCGTGLMIERILREKSSVEIYALDISLGILKKAKEKGLKAHWLQADMNYLPLVPKSFDRIASIFNFSLVARPNTAKRILTIFKDMLVTDGKLLILDAHRAQEVVKKLGKIESRDWYFFPSEVINALWSAGFEVQNFVEFSGKIPTGWEIPEDIKVKIPKEYDKTTIRDILELIPLSFLIVASESCL